MEDFYTTTTVKIPNELIGFRVQGIHGKPISLVIPRKEGLLRKTRPGKAGGHINTNLATSIEHHRRDILTKTFTMEALPTLSSKGCETIAHRVQHTTPSFYHHPP